MNGTRRIGRVAGIPIAISWTWLFVFGLFVWSLATSVFPSSNPGLARAAYVVMAFAAALTFFGSLLLHELGHAIQARRDGVQIEEITLWILGGVARFSGSFPSAGAEFRIAVAGPAVTAVLTVAFAVIAALTHFAPAVDGVFSWLGYINLLLLVFNLLPALPLDGGRMFRSALWWTKGDLAWATRIAATTATVIGVLMMAAGLLIALAVGGFGGLWLTFVGWFLVVGARSEARSAARPTDSG